MSVLRIARALLNPARALRSIDSLETRMYALQRNLEAQRVELRRQIDITRSTIDVPYDVVEELRRRRDDFVVSDRPLVSVCIITYNRADLLCERAVPSILTQTYSHLELIIVGDCCTDDTATRLSRIADPRLTFVNLPERGRYPADQERRWLVAGTSPFNVALRKARGEFITHLDDDDEHSIDRLERLVDFCRSTECDLVWHPFHWQDKDDKWSVNSADYCTYGQVTTSSIFYKSWLRDVEADPEAYRLLEPGDWNRVRRMLYVGARALRYPDANLLRHYAERRQTPSESRA